jgi:hypothetical protein
MRIIITENQYKILLESNTESMQSLIDMAFKSLKERCEEDEYSVLYVENQVHATEEIKVVDVQKITAKDYISGKENSSLFVTIDIYMHSAFEHMDFDEMIWELKQECEKIIGKRNIRLNLREVINTNTDRQW